MDAAQLKDQIPALRRYARALTGSAWAADDLVQDTLERACTKWTLWAAGSNLRAWLFTIMHNIHVSDVRRNIRQHAGTDPEGLEGEASGLMSPASHADSRMDLQRCLLQLPEDQRTVLLLVALEDMSYAEVAKITGSPLGTVMSRLSRARTRLQNLMDGTHASSKRGAEVVPLQRVR
ncbi:RpoE DNA-directed RNA polymerase specialized sigma subunit, sigma24 homolog [Comamonadaceae bacterium]